MADHSRNQPAGKPDILGAIVDQLAAAVAERLGATSTSGPRMISIRESRVPYRILLRAISSGEIPAYKIGRSTYIARDDEDSWIARSEHRIRPGSTSADVEVDEIGELIALSGRRR